MARASARGRQIGEAPCFSGNWRKAPESVGGGSPRVIGGSAPRRGSPGGALASSPKPRPSAGFRRPLRGPISSCDGTPEASRSHHPFPASRSCDNPGLSTWRRVRALSDRLASVRSQADADLILEEVFWGTGKVTCPRAHCRSSAVHVIGESRGTKSSRRLWNCTGCRRNFSWRSEAPLAGVRGDSQLVASTLAALAAGAPRKSLIEAAAAAKGVGRKTAEALVDALEGLVVEEPVRSVLPRAVAFGAAIVAAVAVAVVTLSPDRVARVTRDPAAFASPSRIEQEASAGPVTFRHVTEAAAGMGVDEVAADHADAQRRLEEAISRAVSNRD